MELFYRRNAPLELLFDNVEMIKDERRILLHSGQHKFSLRV